MAVAVEEEEDEEGEGEEEEMRDMAPLVVMVSVWDDVNEEDAEVARDGRL